MIALDRTMRRRSFLFMLQLFALFSCLLLRAQNEPAPSLQPAPQAIHIVRSGDSLRELAQRYDSTVDQLRSLNALSPDEGISPGDELLVPARIGALLRQLVVRPGDTFYAIARRHDSTVAALRRLNNLDDGRQLFAGEQIIVPVAERVSIVTHSVVEGETLAAIADKYETAETALAAINRLPSQAALAAGESLLVPVLNAEIYDVHRLHADDSLLQLAQRYATSPSRLLALNGLHSEDSLAPGQTLLLPRVDESRYAVHRISPGDTLYTLSRLYSTSVEELTALNDGLQLLHLPAGRNIRVPKLDDRLFKTVVVPAGESLLNVATRYNASLESLQLLNAIDDQRELREQQTLLVPTFADATLTVHRLAAGESLALLAARYDTSVATLQALNNIENARIVQLHQPILVPEPLGVSLRPDFGTGLLVYLQPELMLVGEHIAALGVDWVKLELRWADLEPQNQALDFAMLDAMIALLEQGGLRILLQVYAAPAWSRADDIAALPSDLRNFSGPPHQLEPWSRFLRQLAQRYAGRVHAYEIWKAPNILKYWAAPVHGGQAASEGGYPSAMRLGAHHYMPLLQSAHTAIKASDPDALVISAGLAPVGYSDHYNSIDTTSYFLDMLRLGAAQYADAFGVVFSASAVPPTFRCCEKPPGVDSHYESYLQFFPDLLWFHHEAQVKAGGEPLPIVVTQAGWGTAEGANIAVPAAGYEWLTYTSEEEQARYVTQAFALVQGMEHVQTMFLSNLNGCAAGDEEACFFSLVDADAQRRPAYAALASLPKH